MPPHPPIIFASPQKKVRCPLSAALSVQASSLPEGRGDGVGESS